MAFIDRISGDLTAAMRAKDATRLGTLRMAKAALMNKEVERGRIKEYVDRVPGSVYTEGCGGM